jgi:WD40 repeat protein
VLRRFDGCGDVFGACFDPDERAVLTGDGDGRLTLWDLETAKPLRRMGERSEGVRMHPIRFLSEPDRALVLATTLWVWDLKLGRPERYFMLFPADGFLAISADERWVLEGGKIRVQPHPGLVDVVLWDAGTGRKVRRFAGHDSDVLAAAFLPGDKGLVSASNDGTVREWDLASGEERASWKFGERLYLTAAAFSADGSRMVSGNYDGSVRLWDVSGGKCLGTLVPGVPDPY